MWMIIISPFLDHFKVDFTTKALSIDTVGLATGLIPFPFLRETMLEHQ
jgi:hypothetical protein